MLQRPCRGVKLPRQQRDGMRFLTATQLDGFGSCGPGKISCSYPHRRLYRASLGGGVGRSQVQTLNLLGVLWSRRNTYRGERQVEFRLTKDLWKSSPPFLATELQRHLEKYKTPSELVFTGVEGGSLRGGNLRRRVWLPALARSGLTSLRFHDLRHTAAALLIDAGAHAIDIKDWMGHSSITVSIDRFGHPFPDRNTALAASLELAHAQAVS
jgi:integrase